MNQYPNDNPSSDSLGPTSRQVYSNDRPGQNSQHFLPRRSPSERSPHPPPPFSDSYRRDHDLPPLPISALPLEARRESTISTERKRRLTASATEAGRRRTTTGGFTSRDNRYYQTHIPPRRDSTRSSEASSGMAEREVIDLTGSSPVAPENTALPQRSPVQRPRTPSNSSRGYMVPKWQPDGEVSECPICHRPFGFLFRRHHCRKCGRVVCNDCSPHRITIPRQYIVHPPGTLQDPLSPFDFPTIDLTRGGEDDDYGVRGGLYRRPNPALGGGEKVRLCNPCVPDPQPEFEAVLRAPASNRAPVDPGSDDARSSVFTSFPTFQYPTATDSGRLAEAGRRFYGQPPHPGTRVHLGQGDDDDDSDSSSEAYSSGPRYHLMGQHRDRFSPPVTHMHSRYHSLDSRQAPLPPLPPFNSRPRVTSMFDPSRPQYGATQGFPLGMPPRPAHQTTPSGPQPPRPTIREEDMCPVCRGLLPPKGPNGDETDRENHIMECISQHDTSMPGSRQRASTTDSTSRPPTTPFSSSMPAQTIPYSSSGPTPPVASSSSTPPHRTMPTQMLRFPATEKDCTPQPNSDGGLDTSVTECSICMVEYEVGDRLVRLECWCKFHEDCIVEWFGRKAECPVHKLS